MKRFLTIALVTLLSSIAFTAAAQAQFVNDANANGRAAFSYYDDAIDGVVYNVSATVDGSTPLNVYDSFTSDVNSPVTQITAADAGDGVALRLFIIPPASGGTVTLTATPVGGGTSITGSKYFYPSVTKISTTTSLAGTPLSQVYGATVLTATVTASPTPNSGSVTFYADQAPLSPTATVSSGVAFLHAEAIPVGTHNITAKYSGDNTYQSSISTVIALTVTPANLTVTGITAENKVYDGSTTATLQTTGAGLQGVVVGDNVTLNAGSATGTFSDKNIGLGKTVTVAGITMSGSSTGNYNLIQPTTTADISPKALTVTGITAIDKTYDGTTNADLNTSEAALSGVVGRENVNLHANGVATGSFADKNVGTGKPVTVTGIFINGPDGGNYTVTQPTSLTASISKANASVTPLAALKTYGAPDPVLSGSLNGFVGSDNVTATYSRTAGETVAGGPYTISAILSPTAALSNYAITYNTANFTITKATASVTPAAASKTYGAVDPTFVGTLSGFVSGDGVTATYSRTAGENVAGSPYTISATLSPTSVLDNYTVTYNTAGFTINKAPASVTPNAASKVYGTADPAFTGTLTGFVSSDGITASYTRAAGETVAGSPFVISATLSPAGALANYTVTYNTGEFTITKATVTPSITVSNKVYDGTPAATIATGTLSGVIGSDDVSLAGGVATFADANAGDGKTVTGSGFSLSGSSAGNYQVSSTSASTTANITKATASVTPAAASKTYGTADPTLSGSLAGFVSGDGVTAAYSRAAGESAGQYTISAALTPTNVLGNYNITYNTALFTITKALASVTPNAVTKAYGAADPSLTGTLTGFLPADGVTATYSRTAGETVAGSPYLISATLSPAGVLGNYNITYNTANFTITTNTSATVLTSSAATTVYGQSVTFTATVSGLASTPTGTVTFKDATTILGTGTLNGSGVATLSTSALTVGTHSITAEYGGDANFAGSISSLLSHVVSAPHYTLTVSSVHGSVAKAPDQSDYVSGTTVALTATPEAGYHFVNWSGDITGTTNPVSFTMDANKSVTANFAINTYTLSTTATNGTIGKNPDQPSYNHGTAVLLTATPAVGYHFVNWSGDVTGTTNPVSVTMDGNKNVTANFAADAYTLTTTATNGTIAKNPDQPTYNYGTAVQVTATPATGYHFVNWTGDVTGTTNPVSVTMDGNKNVTANFAINTYTLALTATNGTIAKNPDQPSYNHGTAVQLTATPVAGYHFVNWSGDVTGTTNPVSVTMDGNKNVTANFVINTYTLTLTASNGTIAKNPDQSTYNSGTTVQLSATPAPTYHFMNWSGDASGTSNPITVTMDANKNITANFAGNTAPTVGTITAPLDPVIINAVVNTSVTFTDPDPNDPHTAIWNWGDGTTSAGVISAENVVTGSHSYPLEGVYTVGVTVTDGSGAKAMTEFDFVVVYNPNGGFVFGGAWFTSPTGAYVKNPTYVGKGYFAFIATYFGKSPVPLGVTSFQLRPSLFKPAVLDFRSTSYQWLVVTGSQAQYKGAGMINGSGSYGFLLVVNDGNAPGGDRKARFRIKIWDKNNGDALVYDNQPGADDDAAPTTVIDGGLIVVYDTGCTNKYALDVSSSIEKVIEEDAATVIPTEYTLYNAYPNPFNPSTTIRFDLPEATKVHLVVYDMLGREVAVLADGERPAGQYAVRFDAGKLSSGTYIYRLQTGNYVQTRKLMLMK